MIDIHRYDYFALDTETTGLRYPVDKAFGVSVAFPDGQAFYWDLRIDDDAGRMLRAELPWYKGTVICHNASFDAKMLFAAGIGTNTERLDDTVIRACCIDEHLHSYSLDALCEKYLGQHKVHDIYEELAQLFGGLATRNVQMKNLWQAPKGIVEPYAVRDAQLTLALWEKQNEIADGDTTPGVPSIREIWEFERSVMPHLISVEMHGIRVDTDTAERAMEELTKEIDKIQGGLDQMAGRKGFNANSSKQVRELLAPNYENGHWSVNGTEIPSTGTGEASFGAESLRLIEDDPRAVAILNLRSIIKTRDTFLGGHVLGHETGGRVFPTINQTKGERGGTGTGRLSYQDPAMQQIPSRNKTVAAIVKPVFLPDEGERWLDVDLNSFEVRVFAHLVAGNDPGIIEAYKKDPELDFHQWVADLTGLVRNATYSGQPNAKQLNLSMIFNAGNGSIAEQMGLPWEWGEFEREDGEVVRYRVPGQEAMEVINTYHHRLPGVKILQNRVKGAALRRGFIFTKRGRRIHFPRGWKAYKASGLLIQATSADYNKENIGMISRYCLNGGGRLLLNTHDSYSISVPGNVKRFWDGLRPYLEAPKRARVPLLMDVSGYGKNWWDALSSGRTL